MSMQQNDIQEAADTIALSIKAAAAELFCGMPGNSEPYDYSLQFNSIRNELADICTQLERIADHLERKEAA